MSSRMKTILMGCTIVNCPKLTGLPCDGYVHSEQVTNASNDGHRCTCGCLASNHLPVDVRIAEVATPAGASLAVQIKEEFANKKLSAVYDDEVEIVDGKDLFLAGSSGKKRKRTPKVKTPPPPLPKSRFCEEADQNDLEARSLFSSSRKASPKTTNTASGSSNSSAGSASAPISAPATGPFVVCTAPTVAASFWDVPRSVEAQRFAAHALGADDEGVGTDADRPTRLKFPSGHTIIVPSVLSNRSRAGTLLVSACRV